jgi:hypothetical protein|tara:strand:- start:1530 stop:1739 length:210 start_codon:yes stop_codon:yes gene_type:complete
MTLEELWEIALDHFPACHITEDLDGEIVIATGMKMEGPPMGMQGLTAANIPPKYQSYVQLREMTHEDIT